MFKFFFFRLWHVFCKIVGLVDKIMNIAWRVYMDNTSQDQKTYQLKHL